jgi:hypothetical protein
LLPVLLIVGVAGVYLHERRQEQTDLQKTQLRERFHDEPGYHLADIHPDPQTGALTVYGWRDPLARPPETVLGDLSIMAPRAHWQSYLSADPAMVLKRATRLLAPPETATLRLVERTLTVEGRAPSDWIVSLNQRAPFVFGLEGVDIHRLQIIEDDAMRFARLKRQLEGIRIFPDGTEASAWLSEERNPVLKSVPAWIQTLSEAASPLGRHPSVILIHRGKIPTDQAASHTTAQLRQVHALFTWLVQRGTDPALLALEVGRPSNNTEDTSNDTSGIPTRFSNHIGLSIIWH